MDVVGLIKKSYRGYGTLFSDKFRETFLKEDTKNIWIALSIVVLTTIIFLSIHLWRKNKIRKQSIIDRLASSFLNDGQTRFRKRDKMLFYGRRMLRKVKTISGNGEKGKKRRAVMKFARKLLQIQKDNLQPELQVTEPPAEYFEEVVDRIDKVPADALYMLQSIRIFGQFDKPVFLNICKHTEILTLKAGEHLIKIGDADDSVFIVQTGQINVFLNNPDGSSISLKVVKKGETVTSLLSFIDVIVGNTSQYKTVTARAIEESQVIRLPMFAFKEVFGDNPDILVRVIQVIMVRLQRVTISALHNYLGLNTEYIQVSSKKKQNPNVVPLSNIPKPQHKRQMSDQFSLVTSSDQRPDMINDIEFHLVGRRTSNLPQPSDIPIDVELMKSVAIDGFLKELGLKDDDRPLISDTIEIKEIPAGTTLTHQGRADDVLLIYVITGGLTLINHQPTKGTKKKTDGNYITVHPGEVVGGLAVLTGESSLYTIKSKYFTRVGLLTKDSVYKIMQQRPSVVLDIANSVVKGLSALVRQCDFALDWIFLESGRAVYRKGETSDCTYIVLNGRLRSVVTHPNGKKEIVGEFGKGDLIGVVEMITESPRTTTVMAVRDSELAKLPEGLFNAIKLKYPVVVTQLISLLSHRLLGSMQGTPTSTNIITDASPVKHRFSTVAILSISEDVPLTAFTYELYHSLSSICPCARLTADVVRKTLGMSIMESSNEYRLTSWLSQQEDHHDITLYQCESVLTPWTQRCLRQADVILIVGLADRTPTIGKLEREIDRFAIRTAKELVLLHHEATSSNSRPTNTVAWLNQRSWVSKHHHIQCPKRMFTRKSQYRVNDLYTKVLNSEPNIHSDFSRLARWLTGNSVGLVLGGGGARGAAHVGMLKAIQEAGIPIDMVGGVSIGAFMGALWCSERNITTVTQKAREWCKKMTHWGLQLLDLTYPITSMFSGKQFNQTIRGTFGDIHIEDLWLPYFTLTTDITESCARIHMHGSLWRYVRSSMSLAGYMPPLCDAKDGHLLLDGGYVNNLPADVMRAQGAAHIIAVDVGSQDDTDLTDYGDDLSGWWVLYKRYNPFTSPVKVPAIPDIQSRLAYVSCVRQLEQVKNSDYCEYLRPPIDKYKTLAFGSFDEIKEVGYAYGKEHFEKLAKTGGLSRFNKWTQQKNGDDNEKSSQPLTQYTFVDLAQIVCKVPVTCQDRHSDEMSSEDDYFGGYVSEPTSLRANVKVMRQLRTGGSLSLSENEYESDSESDAPVDTEPTVKEA
ncbi:CLUMA_CG017428, isoform A [Clunio marinus]|uniref:Neuropathy target esterase sws n=1 Tax=Clunio marinus TaxID=568069 RepID=A0A1J1IYU6_9DIPT|nr:CLUMA_CG017428, isoform A [Clunio marinus]